MATLAQSTLVDALAASGAEVLTDQSCLEFYGSDIYAAGAPLQRWSARRTSTSLPPPSAPRPMPAMR